MEYEGDYDGVAAAASHRFLDEAIAWEDVNLYADGSGAAEDGAEDGPLGQQREDVEEYGEPGDDLEGQETNAGLGASQATALALPHAMDAHIVLDPDAAALYEDEPADDTYSVVRPASPAVQVQPARPTATPRRPSAIPGVTHAAASSTAGRSPRGAAPSLAPKVESRSASSTPRRLRVPFPPVRTQAYQLQCPFGVPRPIDQSSPVAIPTWSGVRWKTSTRDNYTTLLNWRHYGVQPNLSRIDNPQPGDMYVIRKDDIKSFRRDGHTWKTRHNSNSFREDHVLLKMQRQAVLYGCYASSATVPHFVRRTFWLISESDVALVHYVILEPVSAPTAPVALQGYGLDHSGTHGPGPATGHGAVVDGHGTAPVQSPPGTGAGLHPQRAAADHHLWNPASATEAGQPQWTPPSQPAEPAASSASAPPLRIHEYVPDRADGREAVKMLVVGDWSLHLSLPPAPMPPPAVSFRVWFGAISVPADVTATGALRCFTPLMPAGQVQLTVVASDGRTSNPVPFTFSSPEPAAGTDASWAVMEEHQFQAQLYEQLQLLQAEVASEMRSLAAEASVNEHVVVHPREPIIAATDDGGVASALEKQCMDMVVGIAAFMGTEAFASRFWSAEDVRGLTLAHYTCALGFSSLLMLVLSTAPDYALVASADRPYVRLLSTDGADAASNDLEALEPETSFSEDEEDEDGIPATPFAMACIYGRANVSVLRFDAQIEVYMNAGLLALETALERKRLSRLQQLCTSRGHSMAAATLNDCLNYYFADPRHVPTTDPDLHPASIEPIGANVEEELDREARKIQACFRSYRRRMHATRLNAPSTELDLPTLTLSMRRPPSMTSAPTLDQRRLGKKLLQVWREYKKRKLAAVLIQHKFRAHLKRRLYAMHNKVLLERSSANPM